MKTENNIRYRLFTSFESTVGKFMLSGFLLAAASMIFFSSCQKVIKIDLNSADPRLVVEANITNQPGPYTVKLHHTINYYDSNNFPPVTDATVTLSDDAGNSELLIQTSEGVYQTAHMQGVPGRTYSLKVLYNGKEYDAASTMHNPVPIDSVTIKLDAGGGFGGFGGHDRPDYRVTAYFTDPAGAGNYYRLYLSSNDSIAFNQTRYRILSDKLIDGEQASISSGSRLLPGDSVTVDLESIDESTYMFYSTIEAAAGDGPGFLSAPPANPVNNLSNGGVGYFAAYSYTEKKYVVH